MRIASVIILFFSLAVPFASAGVVYFDTTNNTANGSFSNTGSGQIPADLVPIGNFALPSYDPGFYIRFEDDEGSVNTDRGNNEIYICVDPACGGGNVYQMTSCEIRENDSVCLFSDGNGTGSTNSWDFYFANNGIIVIPTADDIPLVCISSEVGDCDPDPTPSSTTSSSTLVDYVNYADFTLDFIAFAILLGMLLFKP